MKLGMNKEQRDWAAQHDWFVESFVNSYNLYTIVVRPSFEGDTQTVCTDYRALRAWAGY